MEFQFVFFSNLTWQNNNNNNTLENITLFFTIITMVRVGFNEFFFPATFKLTYTVNSVRSKVSYKG